MTVGGLIAVLILTASLVATVNDAEAQDPLVIELPHLTGESGELLEIPVNVSTDEDSLAAFQLDIMLSRPDLVFFEVDTVIIDFDTSYECQVDTIGTLTSGWELIEARSALGLGYQIRLTGMVNLFTLPPPWAIPEYTSGVLLKFFARVRDDVPDTLSDRVVNLNFGGSYYSDPQSELISPVEHIDGSITVTLPSCDCTDYCDMDQSGTIDPLDVSYIVNYVYLGQDARPTLPACPGNNGDWNCDGGVDPLDVSFYVQFVYKSSGVGACNPCDCDPYHTGCPEYP
jgi:hypothetical protein